MRLKMYSEKDDHTNSSIKNIVAIAAGKGGVGKSTVTVNLALAFKEKGLSVGILDADLYGPSIRRMLPEDRLPSQRDSRLYPAYCQGIPMISMAFFRKENEAAVVRAPIANSFVKQFLQSVTWGNLDLLLIDFPPGTGDIQLTLSQEAHLTGAVLVTTPQEVALLDVRKCMNMFNQVNIPIVGIVENMSSFSQDGKTLFLFGKGGGERLAREQGIPFLGEIPIDPEICRCGDLGLPLLNQQSIGAHAYRQVGEQFLHHLHLLHFPSVLREYKIQKEGLFLAWHDQQKGVIPFSVLQRQCPCAGCVEEGDKLKIKEDVSIHQVFPVGRYALRLEFTSGCCAGIFTFDQLKKLSGASK